MVKQYDSLCLPLPPTGQLKALTEFLVMTIAIISLLKLLFCPYFSPTVYS